MRQAAMAQTSLVVTDRCPMPRTPVRRQYVVIDAQQALAAPLWSPAQLQKIDALAMLNTRVLDAISGSNLLRSRTRAGLPPFVAVGVRGHMKTAAVAPGTPSTVVVPYSFDSVDDLAEFRRLTLAHLGDAKSAGESGVLSIGADPRGFFAEQLRPSLASRTFGNPGDAHRLIRAQALVDRGLTGRGVHVAIIDRGLNKEEIIRRRPESWGGGIGAIDVEPGVAPRTSHGAMIARNILDLAPEATLYDVPLIPSRIGTPHFFASHAHAVIQSVIDSIRQLRQQGDPHQPWILVNAWAIFDRATEEPLGDYTENRNPGSPGLPGHPLFRLMQTAVDDSIDVIFAAGNCGQHCRDPRCGKVDRGPGHSIWGANAHPAVLTVGAVSVTGEWMGYSSQGPVFGPAPEKPDLALPSHFADGANAALANTGTSAATALAAGVVAAIRSGPKWHATSLPPGALKAALIKGAAGGSPGWNRKTGHGVLDAQGALEQLDAGIA